MTARELIAGMNAAVRRLDAFGAAVGASLDAAVNPAATSTRPPSTRRPGRPVDPVTEQVRKCCPEWKAAGVKPREMVALALEKFGRRYSPITLRGWSATTE